MHKIVLVDKPKYWTSSNLVEYYRKLTNVKKIGHAGTLDPMAEGLMIILIGKKMTVQQEKYLKQNKTYYCQMLLGYTSDSFDSQGHMKLVTEYQKLKELNYSEVIKKVQKFVGQQSQVVPIFSAVKVNGKKLYQLARKGQTLDEPVIRKIRIFSLDPLNIIDLPQEKKLLLELMVNCQSGTYIRALCNDIGQSLQVGACLIKLLRLTIGRAKLSQAEIVRKNNYFISINKKAINKKNNSL